MQPVLKDRGVNAPVVLIRNQVALLQSLGSGLRVLAVHAAIDAWAYGKGDARGAVVCAGAVVSYTPTKFGEHEHYHVLVGFMLAEVVPEIGNRFGHLGPQACMGRGLGRVGVEGAVAGVEDTGSNIGSVNLRDVLQLLCDGTGPVFNA